MLYKYCSKERIEDILIKDGISLRISQPALMNDPFEFNPSFEEFKKNKT